MNISGEIKLFFFRLFNMIQRGSVNLAFWVGMVLAGCDLINPPEKHPVYFYIDSIYFFCSDTAGTAQQNISDAWVYVGGEKIGVFEMPTKIPVLKEGVQKITVFPGIKLNGIGATRAVYPFMTSYDTTVLLNPDSIVYFKPRVSYVTDVVFDFIEDFEQEGLKLIPSQGSDTLIIKQNTDVFEGNFSGKMVVDKIRPEAIVISHQPYALPSLGYTFLEMHYKTTDKFVVGMYINKQDRIIEHPFLVINPTEKWKKIYVNFTPLIGREGTATSFVLFIKLQCPSDKAQAVLWLDNIKLMHSTP
ncbi:MAG: hypothetical protein N2Z72_01575 [Bacteroidales bacterium]|nr:hypothetical protein [Bacteroidales bacterium]